MRTKGIAVATVVLALLAAGCGGSSSSPGATTSAAGGDRCAKASLDLLKAGTLTIGTDNPAFPPWFGGGTPSGSKWKINDPHTGEGYESAVAYAVAKELGFARPSVEWVYVPFNKSFAPGKKSFDFDINQIAYEPARAKVVDFSDSYYDANQSLVVNAGTKIASAGSVADLRPYKLGAQVGTTSYTFITDTIEPSEKPSAFPTNAGAVQALKNKQIDGLVVDLPTAFYVTAVQVPNSKILGQFAARGAQHFGMVFRKGSPLLPCVNDALATLRTNGTLKRLEQQWLAKATGAPFLK